MVKVSRNSFFLENFLQNFEIFEKNWKFSRNMYVGKFSKTFCNIFKYLKKNWKFSKKNIFFFQNFPKKIYFFNFYKKIYFLKILQIFLTNMFFLKIFINFFSRFTTDKSRTSRIIWNIRLRNGHWSSYRTFRIRRKIGKKSRRNKKAILQNTQNFYNF